MTNRAILCVDDEMIILLSLIQELKKAFGKEFIYEHALNAKKAMNTIEELVKEGIRVVLIISDWLMPDIRGDEFIEIVHAKYPSIKAIMITGNADNEMIEYFRKQNSILAVFKKPWDSEELLTLIRSTFLGDDQ